MGLLESAINGPFYHAGATAETYKDNPDQALLGVNTPGEAYVANSLGGNYTPTTNMYGGPSEDVYAKAARDNVDMTANRIADTAAPAVMASTGLGAPFAAALAAGNALGQGYEMQRMQQQMRDRGYQNLPTGSYSGGGGIASAAKQVQSHGRNKDSMLVHMSPREVKGLQQLAMATGGSLTINPHTGLPEAGWLDSLLPMIGGIGLSMIPGVGPLAAAGIMGAGYGVATGSLEKGLMAGLSAYGGASIGGSLAELGGSAIAEQGAQQGIAAGNEAVSSTLGNQAMDASRGMVEPNMQEIAQNAINPQNFPKYTPEQITQLQQAAGNAANPMDVVKSAGMGNATTGITPAQSMGQGLSQVGSSGANAMNFLDANKWSLAGAALPVAMDTFGQKGIAGGTYTDHSHDGDYLKRISPNFKGNAPVQPNPYYQAQYPGYTYAAGGGLMDSNPPTPGLMDGSQAANVNFMGKDMYPMSEQDNAHYATPSQMPTSAQQTMASYEQDTNPLTGQASMAAGGIARYAPGGYLPQNYQPLSHLPVKGVYSDSDPDTAKKPADQAAMIRFNKALAAANLPKFKMPKTSIKSLGDIPDVEAAGGGMMRGIGGYSDGGRMLKGPGDGMSDSIPATIGSKQPARLADGEFVVPADVVSHLGNGSTDAGAKRLYGMMDKIRKARTGKKKQAPAVNVNKYMPA
jgi:hypothetical protein